MKSKSLGFIGGGRITRIFLQAFANKNAVFSSVVVYDTNHEVLTALKNQFPFIETAASGHLAAAQKLVFIALHPPMIMETLDTIAQDITSETIVLSLAPKISIDKMASKLPTRNIVRVIPNATSYINEGFNPVSFAGGFSSSQKAEVREIMQLLGTTPEVAEAKLEAYALLSAMLPTYFWFQWNELIKLSDPMGLTKEESKKAIQQTLRAAIDLYFDSGLSSEQVMDLIPVKPIGEHQGQISEIYQDKLMSLYEKIKP